MRVAIVIPTTGGPSQILRLQPLRKAPCSLVFTQDDYKPIEISARYNDFVTTGGPLSRALDLPQTRFELRLSSKIESGRSWELPVAIAHWMQLQGHDICPVDTAELVIWSTGALDSDMQIIAQDYHLASKLAQSDTLFAPCASKGTRSVILLPAPTESTQGLPALEHTRSHVIASLRDGMDRLRPLISNDQASPVPEVKTTVKKTQGWAVALAFAIGMSSLSALFWVFYDPKPTLVAPAAEATIPDEPDPVAQIQDTGATSQAMLPELVLHHAPEGTTCRAILFGGREPQISVHSASDGIFDTSERVMPCALGLRLDEAAEGSFAVQIDDALRSRILASDFRADYALAPGQEIVLTLRGAVETPFDYAWILESPAGDVTTLTHRIDIKTEN